MTSNLYFKLLR